MATEIIESDHPPTPRKIISGPDTDLFIVGLSGVGKTSTGESIVGRITSKKKGLKTGGAKINGSQVNVVEIPSSWDTYDKSNQDKANLLGDAVTRALFEFPQGFNALLLVISCNESVSNRLMLIVRNLKSIFGDDVVRQYVICVFTYGDIFKREIEKKNVDLLTWCRGQDECIVKLLFEECCFRCVLFDNRSEDDEVKRSQLTNLISEVDSLREKKARYSFDNFQLSNMSSGGSSEIVEMFWKDVDAIELELSDKLLLSIEDDPFAKLNFLKEKIASIRENIKSSVIGDSEYLLTYLGEMSKTILSYRTMFDQLEDAKKRKKCLLSNEEHMKTMEQELDVTEWIPDDGRLDHCLSIVMEVDETMYHTNNIVFMSKFDTLEQKARLLSQTSKPGWDHVQREMTRLDAQFGINGQHIEALAEQFFAKMNGVGAFMAKEECSQKTKDDFDKGKNLLLEIRQINKGPKTDMREPTSTTMLPTGLDIDLLMIGQQGHDVCATGNSFLGQQVFSVEGGDDAEDTKFQIGCSEIAGRLIRVMSTPKFGLPTPASGYRQSNPLVKTIGQQFETFPQGFNAILLVIPYQRKIAVDELKAIGALKQIFGEDVIRKYVVLVISKCNEMGEEMKRSDENTAIDLINWYQIQDGELVKTLKECNFRFVVFENQTEDENTKYSQRIELLSKVDNIRENQNRYTVENFSVMKKLKTNVIMYESILRDIDSIKDDLERLRTQPRDGNQSESLKMLKDRVAVIKTQSKNCPEQFYNLRDYLGRLSLIIMSMENTICLREKMNEERSMVKQMTETVSKLRCRLLEKFEYKDEIGERSIIKIKEHLELGCSRERELKNKLGKVEECMGSSYNYVIDQVKTIYQRILGFDIADLFAESDPMNQNPNDAIIDALMKTSA